MRKDQKAVLPSPPNLFTALAGYFAAVESSTIGGKVVAVYIDRPEHFAELRLDPSIADLSGFPIRLWGAEVRSGSPKIVYERDSHRFRVSIPTPPYDPSLAPQTEER